MSPAALGGQRLGRRHRETMRRLELRRAFAFDRHFAEQGFELVPA